MTPRCICCNKPLSPVACFDGWCAVCAGKTLHAVLSLRDGTQAQVGAVVAWLRDQGVDWLADVVIGGLPFEQDR